MWHTVLQYDSVTTLKCDCGSTKTIPHAILVAKYIHIISFYLQSCKEINYSPLSEGILYWILKKLKPSQGHSLAGLDDITADVMNGFMVLKKAAFLLGNQKDVLDSLELRKRYLKMEYPVHYEDEKSEYATHSLGYVLSGVTNKNLISDNMKCVNDAVCVECFHLLKTIQIVEEKIQTTADNDIYDASIAIENITYMKHQLRDAQQRKAKKAVLENLDNGSVF